MQRIDDISRMQKICMDLRREGRRIAFVPTMGYLHEGHLALLREGRQQADVLVLSIFVNPAQFGRNEDLDAYPRDLESDSGRARECGVDLLFVPSAAAMYPAGYATYVDVEGELTAGLCGASRPGHFRGVASVVTKLFNIVGPHLALFGQKDFQQLAVIRRMTQDLNLPVEIAGLPIVRESDGLAMSSRNVYLSADERRQALVLSRALTAGQAMVREGERDSARILAVLRGMIAGQPDARLDYLAICHQHTLEPQERVDADSVLLLAVFIGRTRLIDNAFLLAEA